MEKGFKSQTASWASFSSQPIFYILLFFFRVSPLAGPAPARLGPAPSDASIRVNLLGETEQNSCPSWDLIPFQKNLPGCHDLISTFG
jgi:hypothetical protein